MSGPGGNCAMLCGTSSSDPLIYSMRIQELKDAFKSVIPWTFANSNKINTSLHK